MRTIDELVSDASANARFATVVMSTFGGVALVLAMIGLYGVIAFMVHQRRHEFGLRTALGATREQLVQMVLVDGFTLASVGLVIGIVLALVAGRLLRSMLYQVSVGDPVTLGRGAASVRHDRAGVRAAGGAGIGSGPSRGARRRVTNGQRIRD